MNKKILIFISEIVFLTGIILFIGVIMEAGQSIGNGMYVASVYEEYSTLFWVLFLSSGFCGITRVLIDIFLIRWRYRWLWGIFLLVSLSVFILSIPIFRDFAFHGLYDTLGHYSYSLEIFKYGKPYLDDFYPASHVLAANFANITGLTVREVVLLFPVLMYLIGLCNAFIFAWVIDDRSEVRGLIVLMTIQPIFTFYQSMFYPLQIALNFLSLFTALFLRTRVKALNVKDSILLILILLLLPFMHPMVVISALLMIISFFIFEIVKKKDIRKRGNIVLLSSLDQVISPFAILFVSWFTWFSSFRVFGVSLNRIYQSLFFELSGQSFTQEYASVIDRANQDTEEILRLLFYIHGPAALWGILLLIAMGFYLFFSGKPKGGNTFLIVNIITFYGLGVISLVVDIIAAAPNRYINYGVALVPFLIAPIYFQFFTQARRFVKLFIFSTLLLSIIGVFGIGTNNLFFSKNVRSTNHQVSEAHLYGYQFLMDFNSNSDRKIYSSLPKTKEIFALGPYSDQIDLLQTFPMWWMSEAPEHFGFLGEPDRLGRRFDDPEYLIVTSFDMGLYQVGPQQEKFSPQDFAMLEFDDRWHKIYDSGDFSLRYWREDKNE